MGSHSDPAFFDRHPDAPPQFSLAVQTPMITRLFKDVCPGCVRIWESFLAQRGWIDLGPEAGDNRIQTVLRTWVCLPHEEAYDLMYGADRVHMDCTPPNVFDYPDTEAALARVCGDPEWEDYE